MINSSFFQTKTFDLIIPSADPVQSQHYLQEGLHLHIFILLKILMSYIPFWLTVSQLNPPSSMYENKKKLKNKN